MIYAAGFRVFDTTGIGTVAATAERLYIMCAREASRRLYCIIIIIIVIVQATRPELKRERKNNANRIYETTWGRLQWHRGFMYFGMG
jgi:hypothetical protein